MLMTNADHEGQIFLSYPHTNNGFFSLGICEQFVLLTAAIHGSSGGFQVSLTKKLWLFFFFFFFFFSPQLILQKSNGQFQRNLSFFKVPEGVQHFPGWGGGGGGVQLFPGGGGSNCLFPIETHITCDFPGGGVRTPCPPLWIRTWQ